MGENHELEPNATSTPPEGVVISIETPYGNNEPLETLEPPKTEETEETEPPFTPAPSAPSAPSPSTAAGTPPSTPAPSRETIKIGAIPLLIFLCLFFIATFVAGASLSPKSKGTLTKEKDREQKQYQKQTQTKILTTTNNNEKPTKGSPPEIKDIQKTGLIQDQGYYKRNTEYSSSELVSRKAKVAKKSIIWVTGEPNNEGILTTLAGIKNDRSLPIFIITGKETENQRLAKASEYGFSIYQLEQVLETPYSFVLIDDKLLIDASREHWIWETQEPKILKSTANWAQNLIKESKPTDPKN